MIIPAQAQHVKDVYRLICLLENEEFDYTQFEKVYQENIANPNTYYFVYKEDNQCVGFISLHSKQVLHHNGKTGEIIELIVDDRYRNQHIGEQLLNYVEHVARELKLSEIDLSSNMKRTRAHSFYEKHGYVKNHYNLVKIL